MDELKDQVLLQLFAGARSQHLCPPLPCTSGAQSLICMWHATRKGWGSVHARRLTGQAPG